MSDSRWITLLEVSTRTEAEMIKEALLAQGIPAEVFQETAHSLFPGLLATADVCVPQERLAEAKAWLDQVDRGDVEALPDEETGDEELEEDEQ